MGRKKIEIKKIEHDAQRKITFEKRIVGLYKKAMELSVLCDINISVMVETPHDNELQIYSSKSVQNIINRYNSTSKYELYSNDHFNRMIPGKSLPKAYNVNNDGNKFKIKSAMSPPIKINPMPRLMPPLMYPNMNLAIPPTNIPPNMINPTFNFNPPLNIPNNIIPTNSINNIKSGSKTPIKKENKNKKTPDLTVKFPLKYLKIDIKNEINSDNQPPTKKRKVEMLNALKPL